MYYPNVATFYWFVARLLKQLRQSDLTLRNLFPILSDALAKIEGAMLKATAILLESSNMTSEGLLFWDGILGKGEERLCLTATCANAIFDTWTRENFDKKLDFLPNTSNQVKQALKSACEFLAKYATSEKYTLKNAIFSSTLKSKWTFRWRYPANIIMYIDGTKIDSQKTPLTELFDCSWFLGITGYVPENEYQKLLNEKQFGLEPGVERHPYSKFKFFLLVSGGCD